MLSGGSRVGDYEIEAELGEGGMAKVYRARHALLDTLHAVKVLDNELRGNADARQRFLDEARIQAKHLDHPGIVKVTNIVATAEHAALVMELIDGKSLEDCVHELVEDPAEIRRIMLAVLDAVGHAHAQGIVHRDLKPANVLLSGKNRVPKVTDFGIAKVSDPGRAASKKSTHAAARMGTLSYMSPEQIRRAKDVTPRSDIFSLGAMLYELATGSLPFEGGDDFDVMEKIVHGRFPPPREKNPRIDPVFVEVIERALRPKPEDRYASCEEMAAALKQSSIDTTPRPAPGVRPSSGPHAPVAVARDPTPEARAPGSGSRLGIALALSGLVAIGVVLFVVKPGGGEGDLLRPPVAADLAAYREQLGLGSVMSARFETTAGAIDCQLYPDKSPIGVAAFVGLATGIKPWRDGKGMIHTQDRYYDGKAFYRVIPEFVAQAGRAADAIDLPSEPGFAYDIETSDLKHLAGTLAIANHGPGTNGAELVFLVEASPRLDGTETIIGRCKDIDVIRKISRTPRGEHDVPSQPITIQRVRLGWDSVAMPEAPAARPPPAKNKVVIPMERYSVPIENSPGWGPVDAPVTIVAFLDTGEPFSGRLFQVLMRVLATHEKRVRVVLKFHEVFRPKASRLGHLAACAGANQGKLYDTVRAFWSGAIKTPFTADSVRALAKQAKLDMAAYERDIQSATCWARVDTDEKLFARLGLSGTPKAFINGRVVHGSLAFEELDPVVKEELSNTRRYGDIVKGGLQRVER
jgi:serine/threonine-protein kinase